MQNSLVSELQVRIARSFSEKLFGLLARPRLLPGEALLLTRCSSVHTFFMRYAIDVVFLSKDGRALKLVAHLRPWRMAGCIGAASTLELAAGDVERLGLRPGAIVVKGISDPPGQAPL